MTLRHATLADIPLIQALAHRIWWAHYPAIIGSEQIEFMLAKIYSEPALAQQMAEGQVFRIVETEGTEGTEFGFIAVSNHGEGRYFLHKFYLDSEKQGKGHGAEVLRLLMNEHPDLKQLRLLVNRRNYKSVNFYFKVGFMIELCLDTHFGEGFVLDDFQMVFKKRV